MNKDDVIYVPGHKGLVGSALIETLKAKGYSNILTSNIVDLRSDQEVKIFFSEEKIDYVFLCAAKVGGIFNNIRRPAQFIFDNIKIQTNVIHSACFNKVKKLMFLGSSCIYPAIRSCSGPIKETELLSGPLEPTNESYAIAKIAGIKMCQAYRDQCGFDAISLMPCNLYGPNDNFNLTDSHVIPALIKRIYEAELRNAQSLSIKGSGNVLREFLYSYDLADAMIFLMNGYSDKEIINVGIDEEVQISEIVYTIKDIFNFKGNIEFDPTFPDGIHSKKIDMSKLSSLGWKAKTYLNEGLEKTCKWFEDNYSKLRNNSNWPTSSINHFFIR